MTRSRRSHPSVHAPLAIAPSLLVALAFALAIVAGCGGKPAAETPAASTPEPTTTPAPAATGDSVTTPVPVATDAGSVVFVKRCVLCHGPEGRGDGIASKGLNPKPRNFHDQAYMSTRTDAQLLEVIHKGKGAMPRWEGQLSDAEIKAVLGHVRELGRTK